LGRRGWLREPRIMRDIGVDWKPDGERMGNRGHANRPRTHVAAMLQKHAGTRRDSKGLRRFFRDSFAT
jgi:hypothetical protein